MFIPIWLVVIFTILWFSAGYSAMKMRDYVQSLVETHNKDISVQRALKEVYAKDMNRYRSAYLELKPLYDALLKKSQGKT